MAKLTWKDLVLPLLATGCVLLLLRGVYTLEQEYGIVLDAGSSHTTVTLFKWMGDQVNNTGVVYEVSNCKSQAGIDDNEADVEATIEDWLPCVRNITAIIDYDDKGSTPTYLGATAGMRLLKLKNSRVARKIFTELEDQLINYRDEEKSLNVLQVGELSGKEEGFYAWIAANSLLSNFDGTSAEDDEYKTVGILDMGGASAQIAYETKLGVFDGEDVTFTNLYGTDYEVRSSSNLCWGGDEAVHRYLYLLVKENSGATEIEDPCMNSGANRTVTGEEFDSWICITLRPGKRKAYSSEKIYNFKGEYNERSCTALVNKMLDTKECNKRFEYCFTEEQQPPPSEMQFYAFSSYYYVTRTLHKLHMQETVTYLYFTQFSNQYCLKDWSEILQNPDMIPKYAKNYCFLLSYIRHTLRKVYKFSEEQFSNIHFAKKLKQQSLGWSLGLMINATVEMTPIEATESLLNKPVFYCGTVLALGLCYAAYVIFTRKIIN